ncbi:MAG: hypothetical protein AB7N76_11700 [Planctomycetota bacterium]
MSVPTEVVVCWVGGLLAGLALAALHLGLLARALERALQRQRPAVLLLTAPLRVGLPAAGLYGAAALGGGHALCAALVGYTLGARALAARAAQPQEDQPEEDRPEEEPA